MYPIYLSQAVLFSISGLETGFNVDLLSGPSFQTFVDRLFPHTYLFLSHIVLIVSRIYSNTLIDL